ncbi:hypothetical protein RF11_11774 [Thelohanellus kitauei]|uniref:Uncharacterized protein n=1 Tax=Thelohanellus kitauei TaxID=669202 RepID=A0A0C2I660_THEKT|nr:hypothetical protein RF11_11774 [Thelohanellus kitauei]
MEFSNGLTLTELRFSLTIAFLGISNLQENLEIKLKVFILSQIFWCFSSSSTICLHNWPLMKKSGRMLNDNPDQPMPKFLQTRTCLTDTKFQKAYLDRDIIHKISIFP